MGVKSLPPPQTKLNNMKYLIILTIILAPLFVFSQSTYTEDTYSENEIELIDILYTEDVELMDISYIEDRYRVYEIELIDILYNGHLLTIHHITVEGFYYVYFGDYEITDRCGSIHECITSLINDNFDPNDEYYLD